MAKGESTRALRFITGAVLVGILVGTPLSAEPSSPSGPATETIEVDGVVFELVRIPAGRFRMGLQAGSRDERPAREVQIANEFYLGRTEVTVAQFRAFAQATGYKTDAEQLGWAYTCPLPGLHPHEQGLDWRHPGFEANDDHPAVVLSRNDATAFCRWLSERTGRTCRLPTEAEWEYAARAGGGNDAAGSLEDVAWYEENTSDCPHPVGAKAANPWGLHDMQGNAWEWCLDVWRSGYQGAALDGSARTSDPTTPQAIWRYALRGGGWASPAEHLRYGYRDRGLASFASPATGLRIVWDPRGRMDGSATQVASTRETPSGARGQATLSADSQTGRTILTTHGVPFEFVRVPAGEFLMGTEEGSIEKPVHKVRIGYDFEMGRTEVTVAQFRAFVEATDYVTDAEKDGVYTAKESDLTWEKEIGIDWSNPPFKQSDDEPVVCVSWYDAMAFCHWLSAEAGQEIRLPSESEWEHACRAGTTGAYAGPVSAMGWYQYNAGNRTHRVAQRQPNAWGLFDMHGNAWEWCLDLFTTSYEGAPADGRARWDLSPAGGVVSRGGSFRNPPGWLGSAIRMGSSPDACHYNNGFRLVRVVHKREDNGPLTQRASLHAKESRAASAMQSSTPELVPLKIDYPRAMFISHRSDDFMDRVPNLERPQSGPPPVLMVPPGTRNIALGKRVTSSDDDPIIGHLEAITDGAKQHNDLYVELATGLQYITIDLEEQYAIYAVALWHYHTAPRIYFDVIVQIADDEDLGPGATTVFNNDHDNSAGLDVGRDKHYVDTFRGRLIRVDGIQGRFIRLYSNGNDQNELNHYTEVEVYGRPADGG